MFPLSALSFEVSWLFLELHSSEQILGSIYQVLRKTILEFGLELCCLSNFETIGIF